MRRLWDSEKPNIIEERPLHLTLTEPYFCESDNGESITVNSERNGRMIIVFIRIEIEGHVLQSMRFNKVEHTIRANMALLLREQFSDRVISHLSKVN